MHKRVLVGLLGLVLLAGCKTRVDVAREEAARDKAPIAPTREQLQAERETLAQELKANSPLKEVLWDVAVVGHPIKGIWLVGDALYVETLDHYVYAIDATTGITRWTFAVGARLQARPAPASGIQDQILAAQEQINTLLGKLEKAKADKNREDIAKLENEVRDAKGRLTNIQDGDLVYLLAEDKIYCLDRKGGHHYWTQPLDWSPSGGLYATTGQLYLGSYQLARLYMLDARTHRESHFARLEAVSSTTPVYVDPSVYCADGNGWVYSMSNEGTINWKYKTEKAIVADPVVSEKTLYVGSTDYALYALDRNTGVLRWKFETTAPIKRAPVVSGKMVYVRSEGNSLFAVNTADGTVKYGLPLGDRFLGRTQHWTWLLAPNNELVGVNEATGAVEQHYNVQNFPIRVSNPDTARLYLGTPDGLIFAVTESKVRF